MNQNKCAFLLRKAKFVPWNGKPIWQRQCRLFNSSKPAAAAGTGAETRNVLPTPSPCSKTTLLKGEISELVGVKDTLAPNRSSHWCSKRLGGKWKVVCVSRRGLKTHCISNPSQALLTGETQYCLASSTSTLLIRAPRFSAGYLEAHRCHLCSAGGRRSNQCKATSLQDMFHCTCSLFMIWMWLVLTELIFRYECQSKGMGRKGHWNVIRSQGLQVLKWVSIFLVRLDSFLQK